MRLSKLIRLTAAFAPLWIVVTTMPPAIQEKDPVEYAARGPRSATEQAVHDGQVWLARHQDEDGSWRAGTFTSHCTPGRPCGSPSTEVAATFDEGLTGLALLAFLGHGISFDSKVELLDVVDERAFSASRIVENGVESLVSRQREDGAFSRPGSGSALYNDILAAMAVCEAYGMSGDPDLRSPAQRGVDYLVSVQSHDAKGSPWGWSYAPRKADDPPGADGIAQAGRSEPDPDIAVTTWTVLALRTADLSGLSVPAESLQGALAFARSVAGDDGKVGFRPPHRAGRDRAGAADEPSRHAQTLAALGILVRAFVAHDADDPFLALAAEELVEEPPTAAKGGRPPDFHYWHCATLALWNFDGSSVGPRPAAGTKWKAWHEALIEWLLPLQRQPKAGGACDGGGWLPDARWGGFTGNALYCTALNVLTLETLYRYPCQFR